MHATSLILRGIPLILQTCLAIILFRRRTHKSLQFFFAYTVFSIGAQILRYTVQDDLWKYFYVYWTTEGVYVLMGFLAIEEAFRRVFQPLYVLPWFKFILPTIGIGILCLSVTDGILFPPIQAPPLLAMIFVAEIAVRCLQGGIFCLLVILARFHQIPWQNYGFGIVLGFAVSALGSFLTFFLRSEFGTKLIPVIQFVAPVAYIIAVVVWLLAFLRPEPEQPEPTEGVVPPMTPEQLTRLLRRLTDRMKGWLKECIST